MNTGEETDTKETIANSYHCESSVLVSCTEGVVAKFYVVQDVQ